MWFSFSLRVIKCDGPLTRPPPPSARHTALPMSLSKYTALLLPLETKSVIMVTDYIQNRIRTDLNC